MQYIEGRGPEHRAQLAELLGQLRGVSGCLGADLLSSPQQPELCLLESRWPGKPPTLTIPPGCKSWTFTVDESWHRE